MQTSHPTTMETSESSDVRVNITRLGLILGVVATLFAIAGAWFILPYRVGEVEEKVKGHSVELATQKEILIRIDENVKELRRAERRRGDGP